MEQGEIRIPEGEELERAITEAYRMYQKNILNTEEAMFRLMKGVKADMPEEEMLAVALDALDRCILPEAPADSGKE